MFPHSLSRSASEVQKTFPCWEILQVTDLRLLTKKIKNSMMIDVF